MNKYKHTKATVVGKSKQNRKKKYINQNGLLAIRNAFSPSFHSLTGNNQTRSATASSETFSPNQTCPNCSGGRPCFSPRWSFPQWSVWADWCWLRLPAPIYSSNCRNRNRSESDIKHQWACYQKNSWMASCIVVAELLVVYQVP